MANVCMIANRTLKSSNMLEMKTLVIMFKSNILFFFLNLIFLDVDFFTKYGTSY